MSPHDHVGSGTIRDACHPSHGLQAGTQSNLSVGGGVTWLLNRDVRLSLEEDYTQQFATDGVTSNNTNFTNTTATGQYSQNIFAITLRVAF